MRLFTGYDTKPFVLGWIGGGLVTSDGFVVKHFPDAAAYHYPAAVAGAVLVVLLGWIFARRAKAKAKGRPAHQVGGGTTS